MPVVCLLCACCVPAVCLLCACCVPAGCLLCVTDGDKDGQTERDEGKDLLYLLPTLFFFFFFAFCFCFVLFWVFLFCFLCFFCCFVGCLTSQQQASVSQGRICSDKFTCCHTEIEVADPTFSLTQSQYTDTS